MEPSKVVALPPTRLVALPAVKLAAVPVTLVRTPEAGVPKAGAINVLLLIV